MRRNETTEEKIGTAEFFWQNKDQIFEITFTVTRWDEPHPYGDTDAWQPMAETNILSYAINGGELEFAQLETLVGKERATVLIDEALYDG